MAIKIKNIFDILVVFCGFSIKSPPGTLFILDKKGPGGYDRGETGLQGWFSAHLLGGMRQLQVS